MHWLSALCFAVIALLGATAPVSAANPPPQAEAGRLDLTGWVMEEKGPVELNGRWEIYWRQLLTPADLARRDRAGRQVWAPVPATWPESQHEGGPLPGEGYATYRLTIRDPGAPGGRALYLPVIRTAYSLWINGRLMATGGVVGTARAETTPRYRTEAVFFQPEGETVELVLQVANFHHRAGGLPNPLVYGTGEQIFSRHEGRVAFSLFLFGSLVLMGLYQLNFFARRPADRSPLYFGIYCLLVALWTVLVGEVSLTRLVPQLPWELGLKLEYLAVYAGLPVFTLFLRSLYPEEVSGWVPAAICVLGLLFGLLVIATPARVYSQTLIAFQGIMVLTSLYLLRALYLAGVRKRTSAWLSFGAGIVFAAAVYNDIALYDGLGAHRELAPLGLLFMVFAQALNLSHRYAHTFRESARMSAELKQLNESLEQKVAERTLSLHRSQQQVAQTLAAMSVLQERERIAHEIHHAVGHTLTTATVLIEAAMGLLGRSTASAKAKLEDSVKLTRRGLHEVRQAVHALKDAPWEADLVPVLRQLIQEVSRHTEITVDADLGPLEGVTPAQAEVLFQMVQEGLTNSIRHSRSERVRVSLQREDGTIRLVVSDDGQGADLTGFGFGLQALRDRVQGLDGTLSVCTEPGQGFTLTAVLPVHID